MFDDSRQMSQWHQDRDVDPKGSSQKAGCQPHGLGDAAREVAGQDGRRHGAHRERAALKSKPAGWFTNRTGPKSLHRRIRLSGANEHVMPCFCPVHASVLSLLESSGQSGNSVLLSFRVFGPKDLIRI